MISLHVLSGTRPPHPLNLQDRITRAYALPSLASLVAHQAERAVQLGAALTGRLFAGDVAAPC
jgi:hypothetical protein